MTENYHDIYKIGKDLDNYIDNMHLYFGDEKLKSIIKGGDNSYISLDEKMSKFKTKNDNYNNDSESENNEEKAREIIKKFVGSENDRFSNNTNRYTYYIISFSHTSDRKL
jgi:hypothetical protein